MFKQLLHSSPLYSGNIKIIYDVDSDLITLSTIDNIHDDLELDIYKNINVNPNSTYTQDLKGINYNIDLELLYNTPVINKVNPTYIPNNQYYTNYYTQCKNLGSNRFSVYSPIYINTLPRFYALLAIPKGELNSNANEFNDIFNMDYTVLNIVDFKTSTLGRYLKNTLEQFTVKKPILLNSENKTISVTGHSLSSFVPSTKTIQWDVNEQKLYKEEQVYYNSLFKRTKLLHPFFYNIEFVGKFNLAKDHHIIGVYLDSLIAFEPQLKYDTKHNECFYDYTNGYTTKLNNTNTHLIIPTTNSINNDRCLINTTTNKYISRYKTLDFTVYQHNTFSINGKFSDNDYIYIGKRDNSHTIYPNSNLPTGTATYNLFSNNGNKEDILQAITTAINNLNVGIHSTLINNKTEVYVESTIIRYTNKLIGIDTNNTITNKNIVFRDGNTFKGGVISNHLNYVIVDSNTYNSDIVKINDEYLTVIDKFIYNDKYILQLNKSVDKEGYISIPNFPQQLGYLVSKPKLYTIDTNVELNDNRFLSCAKYNLDIDENEYELFNSLLKAYNETIFLPFKSDYKYLDVIHFCTTNNVFLTFVEQLKFNYQYKLDVIQNGFNVNAIDIIGDNSVGDEELFVKDTILFNYPYLENAIYKLPFGVPNVNIPNRSYNFKNLEYFLLQIKTADVWLDNYILNGFDLDKYLGTTFDYFTYYLSDTRENINGELITTTNEPKYSIIGENNVTNFLDVQYTFKEDLVGYKFSIIASVNNIESNPYKTPIRVFKNNTYKTILVYITINTLVNELDLFKLYNLNTYNNEYNLPFSIDLSTNSNYVYTTTVNKNNNKFSVFDYIDNNDTLFGYYNDVLYYTVSNVTVIAENKIKFNDITFHNGSSINYNNSFYKKLVWKKRGTNIIEKQLNSYTLNSVKDALDYNGIFVVKPTEVIRYKHFNIIPDNDIKMQTIIRNSKFGYIKQESENELKLMSIYNTLLDVPLTITNYVVLNAKRLVESEVMVTQQHNIPSLYPLVNEFSWDIFKRKLFDTIYYINYPNLDNKLANIVFNSYITYLPPTVLLTVNKEEYNYISELKGFVGNFSKYYTISKLVAYYKASNNPYKYTDKLIGNNWIIVDLDYTITNYTVKINKLPYNTGEYYIQLQLHKK